DAMPASPHADPELGARLSLTFGQVYLNLGSPAKAQELFELSLAYAEPSLDRAHSVPWQARGLWAEALIDQGRFDRAAERLGKDIQRYRQEVGPEGAGMARLVHTLGVARLHQGQPRSAATLFRQAIRLHQHGSISGNLPDTGDGDLLALTESRHRLAQALLRSGDLSTAEQLLQGVLDFRRHHLGDTHPTTVTALGDLAALALYRGQPRRAADLFAQVLERHRAVFGTHHPHVAVALQNLATAEKQLGLLDLAETHLHEAVAMRRRLHGDAHPAVADALYALGRFVHQRRDFDEAEAIYRQVLEIRRAALGEQHPRVGMALLGLADLDWSRGRLVTAERLYREVIRHLEAAKSTRTVEASYPYFQLGLLLLRAERYEEAERWLSEAYDLRRRFLGAEHKATVAARAELNECREQLSARSGSVAAVAADTNDPR
ncbi:MAG: tetratricopeptide repeat protein, partial [Holophagales bacterium]|nr:tetratricopeptide repeat protein [Holophagales bacterium]